MRKASPNLKITLVSTRNWEPNYNIETLLESVRILEEKSPGKFRIRMAGSGSQLQELTTRNADLIANGIVFVEGRLSEREIIDLLSSSDIYLSASNSDGISVSMLEAQAVGLPVVVSRIPSNLEWIEHGQTGLLFDQKNPLELAETILEWVSSKKMNVISLSAREKVISCANFSENIKRVVFSNV